MQAKHVKGTISICAALIAGVALIAASGAGAAKAPSTARIDVSTKAAVVHYLRSIHVNPKGVVIQRGSRNYAGARCPGSGWTCASTKHTVVQIAKRGGRNRFVCKSSKCVVVQISGTSHGVYASGRRLASTAAPNKGGGNSGVCVKTGSGATTGGGQSCTISQVGSGLNTAGVYENTMKVSGLTQTAQYNASITQQSSGAGNTACVTQIISLDGSTTNTNGKPTTANLQAHQSVTIKQDVAGSGTNSAVNGATSVGGCDTTTLGQSQTLTSTITATGPITQNEDAGYTPCGDSGVAPTGTTNYANLCLDIEQNQGSGMGNATGPNNAAFTQTSTQTAIANATKGAAVNQTQSTPLCDATNVTPTPPQDCAFPGGLVGTLNQYSTGKSTASAFQNETQCEDAAISGLTSCSHTQDSPPPSIPGGLHQTEYGPVGVGNIRQHRRGRVPFQRGKGLGQSIQSGNTNCTGTGCDSFTVTQLSTQNADANATLVNKGQADCNSIAGSCTAGQTTTVNGSATSDGYTAPLIGNLTIICQPNQNNGQCKATPPPKPEIATTPLAQDESTSATFTWTDDATAGVTFTCSLDGDPEPCDSSTSTSYTNLPHGPHTFEVTATDGGGNTSDADSFSWEIIPYLTFEKTDDGAAAGWQGAHGFSPITLTTGSDYPGTYAQFTIHDRNDLAVSDLDEPTFTTETYSGGSPRYEIDFSNGDYAFGYPTQQGWDPDSWDLNCGHGGCVPMSHVSWGAIQTAEDGETVTDALIDADFPANATYNITGFTFDGYSLGFFTD